MQETITNNILACCYLLMWIVTFIWYHFKHHSVDAGSGIIFMYILYGIISIDTLNDPIFSMTYNDLTLFPYIYLYGMMILAMSPIINHHFHPTSQIEDCNSRILQFLTIIIVLCAFMLIPNIATNFSSGLVKLFTDTDAGKDAYMESAKGAQDSGGAISNIPAVIFNSLSDIGIFLAMYYMTLKSKKKWTMLLWFAVGVGLLLPVISGQRTGVITSILTIFGAYLLFKKYLSKKANLLFKRIGLIGIILIMLPVGAITISRFGDRAGGTVTSFLNWYIGQGSLYFNNYGLDAGGIRNGERTANLFVRIIKSDVPKNYVERREKYHNLEIDDYYFTTFVGDFTLDYGAIAAVIIFLIIYGWIYYKTRTNTENIKLHQLLLLYITMCISMQGGMYLFNYSDTANLKIITFILLYGYLRYHEELLKRFPLTTKNKEEENEDKNHCIISATISSDSRE